MSDDELERLLLDRASAGQLMPWLAAEDRPEAERKAAVACLAQLQRERRLDMLQHLDRPDGVDEWRADHLSWCRVYRELLPLLDDEAVRIVSTTVRLATGVWEPTFQDAFLDWCSRDVGRIDQVLALADEQGIPDFCFAAALIAAMRTAPAAYITIAAEYVRGARGSRMPGIRGMGAMSVDDNEAIGSALSVLGRLVDDGEASIRDRVDALTAALEIAQRSAGPADGPVAELASRARATGISEFLYSCCHVLVRFGSEVRPGILQQLLAALQELDIDAPETQRTVDSTLFSLLTRGHQQEALMCLEVMLRKSRTDDPLDALGSTTHHLARSACLMPIVVSRWLMTGERALCAAARRLLTSTHNQKFVFDFKPGNEDWPDKRTVYLARKAIGWLMPHGTAPASFLVCLLRNASPAAGKELGELLFDPLLLNYPLATRAYLDAVRANLPDVAKAVVEEVLKRDDAYKSALEDVGFVPELQPTERHRWIEHRRQADAWAKARSKAESKSVISRLATRQTMLYGTHAIDYVKDPGGGVRRLDNLLKTLSYTADNAMVWVYDPCGLDFVLRLCRAEKMPE